MSAAVHKFRGHDYMPINLKGVLLRLDISQTDLAKAIRQSNGVAISRTAASFLVNFAIFPRTTTEAEIKRQTEAFLRERGASDAELATLWQPSDDDLRNAKPPGGFIAISDKAAAKRAAKLALVRETTIDPVEPTMLSPHARRHFRLFRDPFQDEIGGPDDVFIAEDQRYIGEAMFQTAKHGGFLAVVGESGSGKSTLRKMLIERIRDMPIRLIFPQTLDKSKLSTGNICQAIINDLAPGTTVRSSLEAQARQVRDVLLASARAESSHTLLIEEAHDISITTLKYLKRFYEIEDGFRKLLSIVLIGQPELKNKLNERFHPEAREVIRRIEVAELAPLGQQLEAYLAHKFKRLGVDPATVFADDAVDAIRARWNLIDPQTRAPVSSLYPLIVNNTVTKAMNKAAELGVPLVTGDVVRRV